MTSEADSTPRRRPPTIDLQATEVESEKRAGQQAGDDAPRVGDSRGGTIAHWLGRLRPQAAHLIGAAVGVVVMIAVFAALWLGGYVPSGSGAPASGASPTLVKDISARLDKVEAALAARRPDETLTQRLAIAEAETKALDNSLAALNRRLDEIAVTARGAAVTADAAKSAAQGGAERADIEKLGDRVTALERSLNTLAENVSRRPEHVDDRAARLTVAAEALRAAVERGASYGAELAAVKSLGVDDKALAPLASFAADGLPSTAALAQELAALAPELLRAAGATARDGSFIGRLEANAQKLVRITPADAPGGDEPSAVAARIAVDAARADTAAALGEIGKLPAAARALAEPWVKQVEARDAAIAASRRIATAALAALVGQSGQ